MDLGYPVLKLYQPLYHLLLALLDGATAGRIGFDWWIQLSILFLPLRTLLGILLGMGGWLEFEGLDKDLLFLSALLVLLLGPWISKRWSSSRMTRDPQEGSWSFPGTST